MIEYGRMINNQLIKHKSYQDGDKPIVYAEMPSEDGCRAIFSWEETADEIQQVWELVEDHGTYEDDISADEIVNIIFGGVS